MSREKERVSALKVSIKQGSASSAATSLGDSSMTPFSLALGANSFDIGVLNAVTGLIGPVAQLWGSNKEYGISRQKLLILFEIIQAFLWIPIAAFALYAYHSGTGRVIVYASIIVYAVIFIFANAAYPAWFSWMGDVVKENERGKYFGKRNAIIGAVGLIIIILASLALDYSKSAAILLPAFALLFGLASVARLVSAGYFKRQYEPKNTQKAVKKESFIMFMKEKSNLSRFAWALTIFNFSLMIASPFFAVYMLTKLGFSYFAYTLVIMSNTAFYLIFTPIVGKFADKYGSTPLLKISCWLFALSPPLWLLSKNPAFLIFVPQLISGLANATLSIATTNFSYEAISKQKRGQFIAYINILVGVGIFVGSLLGGALLSYLPQGENVFFSVFIISSIARAIVALTIIPRVKAEKKFKSKLPRFSFNMFHPLKTIHTDMNFIRRVQSA